MRVGKTIHLFPTELFLKRAWLFGHPGRVLLFGIGISLLNVQLYAQRRSAFAGEAVDGFLSAFHPNVSASTASGANVRYAVVQLGGVEGRQNSFMPEPHSINNKGITAGYSFDGSQLEGGAKFNNSGVGFLSDHGAVTPLPLLPGWPGAFAFGLNDNNQVYGEAARADVNGVVSQTAVLWENGTVVDLGTVLPNSVSFAAGINNRGEVVANSISNETGLQTAFLWRSGNRILLPVPEGVIQSGAHWINDANQIAGALDYGPPASGGPDQIHACLWSVVNEEITVQDLGFLPRGDYSLANYVNNRSEVVGYATDRTEFDQAFYWFKGPLKPLGNLPGGTGALALSLNQHGQILGNGTRSDGSPVPILWESTGIFDLNDLVPAGTAPLYAGGGGINENGEITSTVMNPDGTLSAVLLTPQNTDAKLNTRAR